MENNIGLYIKGLVKVPPDPVYQLRIGLLPAPVALPATNKSYDTFTANWTRVLRATGYLLDIAFDEFFQNKVTGYDALDVGDIQTLKISDLGMEFTYYYRIRAYDSSTTSLLSNVMAVTTTEMTLLDLDGNGYEPVIINGQEWIDRNFKCTKYADGSAIPHVYDPTPWQNDTAGAYEWPTGNIIYKVAYGAIYSCNAIRNAKGIAYLMRGGVQQTGWRVPLKTDFENLADYLGGPSVAGDKLKEVGTAHWFTNDGGTNEIGFNLRAAGYIDMYGGKYLLKGAAYLHCADNYDINHGYYVLVDGGDSSLIIDHNVFANGFSLRIVRDL
jgi:uncharacterized protein (TIGR02145 family)